MLDLTPATGEVTRLLQGVTPDRLAGPSPCEKWQVVQVVDHLMSLCLGFIAGAEKQAPPAGGRPEPASELPPDWREELPRRLDALAAAWADPAAWQGMTNVAGVDMPGEVCALVALDEVLLHGWDLARATGQEYRPDPELVAAVYQFWAAQEGAEGDLPLRDIIFGPVVPVPDEAPVFERLLGVTGRDPSWRP